MAIDMKYGNRPIPQSTFSSSSESSSDPDIFDSSFMKRLFNRNKKRSASTSTPVARNAYNDFEISKPEAIISMEPSPHTHPLLSKPYARDEPGLRNARGPLLTYAHLEGGGRQNGEGFSQARRLASLALSSGHRGSEDDSDGGTGSRYSRNLRDREKHALAAAVDGNYVRDWGYFIKSYAEGRYNISNPPEPPPKRPSFDHLSAPAPPNESQRLKAVKACNVTLTPESHEKHQRLVVLARKVFQTRMASISFIEEKAELFKAEHSFSRRFVKRGDSIGAHVLLSNEPMVVLDTEKDWRLQGNPLVKGAPFIRFYAGAPIITYEGQIVGVFAVFDTQYRSNFNAASKRKLMDFARLAMTEFELAQEERNLMSKHIPTKIVGKTKIAEEGLARRTRQRASTMIEGLEEDARRLARSSGFLAGEAAELKLSAPHSRTSSKDFRRPSMPALRMRKLEDEPLSPKSSSAFPSGNSIPPVPSPLGSPRPTLRQLTIRASKSARFLNQSSSSSSTASSSTAPKIPPSPLLRPTNTPKHKHSKSTDAKGSRDLQQLPTPKEPVPSTPTAMSGMDTARSWESRTTAERLASPQPRHIPSPLNLVPPKAGDPGDTLRPALSPLSPIPTNPLTMSSPAEITFATSLIARSLSFDLVYLLRVSSQPPADDLLVPFDQQQISSSVVRTKVITSHGLPDPAPVFDANLHMRALRSVRGLIYQNPAVGDEEDDVGFQLGILLPLCRDVGPVDEGYATSVFGGEQGEGTCKGGVVLAAFTRSKKRKSFDEEEVKFLRSFGEAMKGGLGNGVM